MKTHARLSRLLTGVLCCLVASTVCAGTANDSAPQRQPNVLIWMIDDAGFAQLGSFGGPIDTPVLDALARNGLRYTNFHTTAICSATRAALLTGRNHHAVNMGSVTDVNLDVPGYSGRIPKSAASLARVLQVNGYATVALGKWHQTPGTDVSLAGPFDTWPSGQGFDHFYGFIGGDAHQFSPQMWRDHSPLEPARGRADYDMTVDLADQSIRYLTAIRSAAPLKPVFLYLATGAVHAPHQAPRSYIEKYKGRFASGWDAMREQILQRQKQLGIVPPDTELPPRPEVIPAWESLSADQKRVAEKAMEVFAAQLEHADREFGRILDQLRAMGELENTIVIVTSDNGASAEGGPEGNFNEVKMMNGLTSSTAQNLARLKQWGGADIYNHYPTGWAMAGNTPFKFYKQTVHFGGIRDPLIIAWPSRITQKNQLRNQFHHVNDVMPTLLDMIGIQRPQAVDGVAQEPFDGVSMQYSLADASVPTRKRVQYFNMSGNVGIWSQGWKAVLMHRPEPWNTYGKRDYSQDRWELYHTDVDANEMHDLAQQNTEKLKELQALYAAETGKNNATPLDMARTRDAAADSASRQIGQTNGRFVFYLPGAIDIGDGVAPPIKNRSYRIETTIEVPRTGVEGVLVSQGGHSGGYSLYVVNDRLRFTYNYLQDVYYTISAPDPLPAGPVKVAFVFKKTGDFTGTGELQVNGRTVARGKIDRTIPAKMPLGETFDVGRDQGTPVSTDYASPFAFTGGLSRLELFVTDD